MFGHFQGIRLVAVRFKRLKLFGPYDHGPEAAVRGMVSPQALLARSRSALHLEDWRLVPTSG